MTETEEQLLSASDTDGVVTIVSEVDRGYSGVSELADEDHLTSATKPREKLCSVLIQVSVPFIVAGFGMMAAGLLLDAVQVHTHTT